MKQMTGYHALHSAQNSRSPARPQRFFQVQGELFHQIFVVSLLQNLHKRGGSVEQDKLLGRSSAAAKYSSTSRQEKGGPGLCDFHDSSHSSPSRRILSSGGPNMVRNWWTVKGSNLRPAD